MADTIQEAIEDSAKAGIESATADGVTVQAQDLAKQIEADRYIAGKTARTRNHFGLTFVKLEAPGAG